MPQLIPLPNIRTPSGILLEQAQRLRRSKRSGYRSRISLDELSRLLFAGYGKTEGYHHTVPSAGATYPLELFLIAKNIDGLAAGIYRYAPENHSLEGHKTGNFSKDIERCCGKYTFAKDAPVCIIISADFSRTISRYKERGAMYVHMEAGSAYQNISLEAANLGLGTVVVGAFDVKATREFLGIEFEPLCILPVG